MKARNLAAMNGTSALARYGGTVLIVSAALAIISLPAIGKGLGTVLFVAVVLSAWLWGLGPGLFATFLVEFIAIIIVVHIEHSQSLQKVLELLSFLGLGIAITLVIEALHSARRREQAGRRWLSAVLTSIGDAVIATDDRGRVLFINPVAESLCGWSSADGAGRPLDEVFHIVNEQTRETVESPVVQVLAEGVVVGLANHTLLIARDGTERPIDDSGAPIRRVGGAVEGVVLVFRDVTERRLAEARAADEARRKDEFLAMLAHELRNPLAAIANSAQLLAQPDAEEFHGWSREVIDRQVRQLTRLVDDLLDVSRISRGKIQLRPQRVDLATIVRSAAQVVQPLMVDRGHAFDVTVEPASIELRADPVRLEQVMVNLLNNAAKYTEPGGRIELHAALDEGHAVVRVSDTGIGIGPDLLPRVFDLFTQGDRGLARAEGGLGIGLTMVQKLSEMHGGFVTVASAGPGRGSTFTIRLPVQARRTGGAIDGSLSPGTPAPARILLIDDNLGFSRSLSEILLRNRYVVEAAHSGPEGLTVARHFRPELVLVDIALPGMSGYEVLTQLREDPASCQVKIIAVTKYGHEDERRRALDAGFDGYLPKPIDPAMLPSVLRDVGEHCNPDVHISSMDDRGS